MMSFLVLGRCKVFESLRMGHFRPAVQLRESLVVPTQQFCVKSYRQSGNHLC